MSPLMPTLNIHIRRLPNTYMSSALCCVLVTLPGTMIKHPGKHSSKEKGFILALGLRVRSIMGGGESRQQEPEVDSHITPIVRKQNMNA